MVPIPQTGIAGTLNLSEELFPGPLHVFIIWVLHEVGACELSQDAEGTRLGGASAGLPVLSVLNQPLLAAVVGNKTGDALHPEAVLGLLVDIIIVSCFTPVD